METCRIVEDLLPLYEEELLQEETRQWVESHLKICESCRKLSSVDLPTIEEIPTPQKSAQQMIKRAQTKLMIYQFIFVLLSFVFAMNTTLLSNRGFTFILSYFLLGAVTYYFYRRFLITAIVSFVPMFIWTIYDVLNSYSSIEQWTSEMMQPLWKACILLLLAGVQLGGLHMIFALLGASAVFLMCKAFSGEEMRS